MAAHCSHTTLHARVLWGVFVLLFVLSNGYFSSEVGMFSTRLSTFTISIMYSEAC